MSVKSKMVDACMCVSPLFLSNNQMDSFWHGSLLGQVLTAMWNTDPFPTLTPILLDLGVGFGAPLQAQRQRSASVIIQVKDNFESIKSQYEKIQIKGDLIISNVKRTGISSDDHPKFYIISQQAIPLLLQICMPLQNTLKVNKYIHFRIFIRIC